MKASLIVTLASLGGISFGASATATDLASPLAPSVQQITTENGWTFTFSPYFWVAGLSGDVGQFGLPTVNVDASFGDIFDHLDFAAMAMAEARYGPYTIFGDFIYSKISGQGATPRGVLASDVELSSETFAGLVGLGYAIFEDSTSRLDLVGGLRVWSVTSELSFRGGILDGVSRSDDATWVDGMVGFRGTYSITPEVFLTGWGLVGTGGADLDWDAAAGIGYRFNDTFSAVLGYRALGVDYDKNGFVFDVVQKGPIVKLDVRF